MDRHFSRFYDTRRRESTSARRLERSAEGDRHGRRLGSSEHAERYAHSDFRAVPTATYLMLRHLRGVLRPATMYLDLLAQGHGGVGRCVWTTTTRRRKRLGATPNEERRETKKSKRKHVRCPCATAASPRVSHRGVVIILNTSSRRTSAPIDPHPSRWPARWSSTPRAAAVARVQEPAPLVPWGGAPEVAHRRSPPRCSAPARPSAAPRTRPYQQRPWHPSAGRRSTWSTCPVHTPGWQRDSCEAGARVGAQHSCVARFLTHAARRAAPRG